MINPIVDKVVVKTAREQEYIFRFLREPLYYTKIIFLGLKKELPQTDMKLSLVTTYYY